MIVLFLAASAAAHTAAAVPAPPPLAVRKAIMAAIGDKLLDGDTARYRWPDVPPKHTITYCGFVNAKNSYGAYIGFQPFSVAIIKSGKNPNIFSIEMPLVYSKSPRLEETANRDIIVQECVKAGFDLDKIPPALDGN